MIDAPTERPPPHAQAAAPPVDAGRPAAAVGPTPERERPSRVRQAWEWARPLIVLLVVLSSFRSAVADWNDVPTGSMKPTILEGDRVFVNKMAYDLKVPFTTWHLAEWGDPARGDVVVLLSPENGRRLIKRVIGVPGDDLAWRGRTLYVNGEPASYAPIDPEIEARLDGDAEPFRRLIAWEEIGEVRHPVMVTPALHSRRGDFGPVSVPEEGFFLMGDNRDESRDSRAIGFVPRELILGRAIGVAFSLDREDLRFRADRFFDALE